MQKTASLPRYIALAKNVRGIFAFDPANDPPSTLKTWLARIHQYRNVGLTPTAYDQTGLDLSAKTFKRLPYPVAGVERVLGHLSQQHPRWMVEALAFSSAYVTPLFIHRPALPSFEPTAVWQLHVDEHLASEQIKRHMRIAGYGMLDFHREFTSKAAEALKNGELTEEQQRRKNACTEDGTKRFWRLLDEDEPNPERGTWVGGYCDLLALMSDPAIELIRSDSQLNILLGTAGVFIIEKSD